MTGSYNRTIFFDSVRNTLFGGRLSQSQVDGMEADLAYVEGLQWLPVDDQTHYFLYWTAYGLATDYHETARTMQPIEEYGSESYLRSKPYYPYYGRGKVQLTWAENYQRSDREIADGGLISQATLDKYGGTINQHGQPDQALDMEVACCNLFIGCWKGWYTGHKFWDHLTNDKRDYWNARRIVNGTDRASDIAGYAELFEEALRASWQEQPVEVPPVEQPPGMPPPCEEPMVTLVLPASAARIVVEQLTGQLADLPPDDGCSA